MTEQSPGIVVPVEDRIALRRWALEKSMQAGTGSIDEHLDIAEKIEAFVLRGPDA